MDVDARVRPRGPLLIAAAVIGWFVCGTAAGADEPAGLKVTPARADLRGPEAVQQLVVEGPDGRDLTDQAKFSVNDPAIAQVHPGGVITAEGDGQAVVTIEADGRTAEVQVAVSQTHPGPPINFTNQIVPIFTKLGCNSGGCHGKSGGQNGFRLSLLGFEPALDYETIVKEGRSRRVFPAAPEESLLLRKAVGRVPHGGGKKLDADSHEFRLIVRWIGSGMPMGKPDDPTVARIEVYPPSKILAQGARQQLVVTAHYTDGHTEDVTRWAQYQSNETEVAGVEEGGRVEAHDLSGGAAVMARYQSQVAVFRAMVPLDQPAAISGSFTPVNFLDERVLARWQALGLAPSEPCSDAEFIRRASLDICGTLPDAAAVRAFAADANPEKRARLVDQLLARPEYAAFFATKWADILHNKREGNAQLQPATYRFHDWIQSSLARNVPYDRFVRGVVAATGTPETAPAVMWFRKLRTPDAFVDDTAQVFLGMRLQCAKCHHHPFEVWSEDDYYGFAAFFGKIGRKPAIDARRVGRPIDEAIFLARDGSVTHPKTGKTMEPKGLGGSVVPIEGGADPRQKLADWMTDPANPFFARALVNRYWAHFFGRGIVEPIDDMRVTNPPSNPELLDALASDFIRSGYDLKHLIRTIATSRVYGLSSIPNETNIKDRQSFARRYPKRLPAEVLLDGIAQVSGVPTAFGGFPSGTRAIELPDESVASTFLDAFGRPKRDTACECERVTDASLGQSLMLLNSAEVQQKLAGAGGRAEALAADPRPDPEKVAELFWSAFAREPGSSETAAAVAHLAKNPEKRKEAYEDIIWALINAKEFQFND